AGERRSRPTGSIPARSRGHSRGCTQGVAARRAGTGEGAGSRPETGAAEAGGVIHVVRVLCLTIAGLFLLPDLAFAWGPATHVYLGQGVLESLHLLPQAVRAIIAAHPFDFLYGSMAADISLAKKYVPEGRHCHHWHVGEEIFESAETARLRAVGLGYLAHLAGDTVAHNYF